MIHYTFFLINKLITYKTNIVFICNNIAHSQTFASVSFDGILKILNFREVRQDELVEAGWGTRDRPDLGAVDCAAHTDREHLDGLVMRSLGRVRGQHGVVRFAVRQHDTHAGVAGRLVSSAVG